MPPIRVAGSRMHAAMQEPSTVVMASSLRVTKYSPGRIFADHQLVEIVALAAGRHPETDSGGIAQRPQQRDLVVAEKDGRVGAVASVPERADPKHSVVDEVSDEDGVPQIGWIRLQGFEEPLQVAVNVADDQDRQIVRSHSSPG